MLADVSEKQLANLIQQRSPPLFPLPYTSAADAATALLLLFDSLTSFVSFDVIVFESTSPFFAFPSGSPSMLKLLSQKGNALSRFSN
jgi:hypothetical protein